MLRLAAMPLWLSALLFVLLPTLLAMAGPLLVRRYVTLEKLTDNNEIAGFKFAALGVVYAVMLAFAVVVVWEKFRDAEEAVAREAGAAVALDRLSNGLAAPERAALREGLRRYLRLAIAEDWPAMSEARAAPSVTAALAALYTLALAADADTGRGSAVLQTMLETLSQMTEARRERLALSGGVVPALVWLVLVVSAVLTMVFTFFFGTRNLAAQIMMTGMLGATIFLALLVVLAVEHPFTGDVHVGPGPLQLVLEGLGEGG